MSKFIDKLSKLSKASPAPMGFRTSAAPRPAPMLLIGQLAHVSKDVVEALKTSNLDALIVESRSQGGDVQELSKLSKSLNNMIWGAYWAKGTENGALLAEAGADFVLADPSITPAAILSEKRLGHILAIEEGLTDGMIAAVDGLGTNAILLRPGFADSPFITIGNLLGCQRVARLLRKPLLVGVSFNLSAVDLQALVGVGIKGVVVRIPDKESARRASDMKTVLGTLTATKKESEEVIVPSFSAPEPAPAEETEEP